MAPKLGHLLCLALCVVVFLTVPSHGLQCDFSDEDLQAMIADFQEQGFDVTPGKIQFFNMSTCEKNTDLQGKCQYQNGDNPYGMTIFPRSPAEPNWGDENPRILTQGPIDENTWGFAAWRLRHDEAIVWVGCTPPEVRYWGTQPYILAHHDGREWSYLFASLGDSINKYTLKTAGPGIFDTRYAQSLVMDQNIASRVDEVLARHTPGDAYKNRLTIGYAYYWDWEPFRFGLEEHSDVFNAIFRMAYPVNRPVFDEFIAKPTVFPLRLTPKTGIPKSSWKPFPPPQIRSRRYEPVEDDLAPALDIIKGRIAEQMKSEGHAVWPSLLALPGLILSKALWGADCYNGWYGLKQTKCYGDTRDTTYTTILPIMQMHKKDALWVFGVSHNLTDIASYTNVVLYDMRHYAGVVGTPDSAFGDSAAKWLQGTEYENKAHLLYAIKYAFECPPEEKYCFEIPYEPEHPFPSIAHGESGVTLIERAYLNRHTTLGPEMRNIAPPGYLLIKQDGDIGYKLDFPSILFMIIAAYLLYTPYFIVVVLIVLYVSFRVTRSVLRTVGLVGCCEKKRKAKSE